MNNKYPIMDQTGMVAGWLAAGRGVRVWPCQEIGSDWPDSITPGDRTDAPDWRYTLASSRLLGPDDVVFFSRFPYAERLYSDTPAGWKAAERLARKLESAEPNNDATGAPLAVSYRYSVDRIKMIEADPPAPGPDGIQRGHVAYHVAVFRWSAILGERKAE